MSKYDQKMTAMLSTEEKRAPKQKYRIDYEWEPAPDRMRLNVFDKTIHT